MTSTVLIAVLAKNKAYALPLYLECLYALDYPKEQMGIYIRSNNNTDETETVLKTWTDKHKAEYKEIVSNYENVEEKVEQYGEHEWNEVRFKVLAAIRQQSLEYAYANGYDYYFVVDCDNFIINSTLKHLINSNKPIIGPLLRKDTLDDYSNWHHCIDSKGYFKQCNHYYPILHHEIKGQVEVNVIHCTYLIARDYIPLLSYGDNSKRHEYVIFSESCRKNKVAQYLDNTRIWGYLTFNNSDRFAQNTPKLRELIFQ